MNKKQLSIILASMMSVHSVAFSMNLNTPVDTLKAATQNVDMADLKQLVDPASDEVVQQMIGTYKQIKQMSDSLRAIQDGNEHDFFLKNANKIQLVLVSASTMTLGLHIKASEKKSYVLALSAASALLNTVQRHYAEIKNLKPSEMGHFLYGFEQEMEKNKMLTPEMVEMSNSLGQISSELMTEKTQLNSLVTFLGGGSDITTGALILLSIAHYVAPKLAKEGEAVLKTVTQKIATGGASLAQSGKVVGGGGALASLPNLLGVSLGMDSERSQELITATLIKLDKAARNLQLQIPADALK